LKHKKNFPQHKRTRINDWIRISPVRLIDQDGQNKGVVDLYTAKKLASEADLDLIEIAPNTRPPVCRIMDFGKYQYQQSRKEKEQRHKQKKIEVKAVRISPRIGQHDLETKAKQASKFLKQGHKVRVEIRLRGREKAHLDFAQEKLQQFIDIIAEPTQVDQPPKKEPRGLTMVISLDKELKKDETKN